MEPHQVTMHSTVRRHVSAQHNSGEQSFSTVAYRESVELHDFSYSINTDTPEDDIDNKAAYVMPFLNLSYGHHLIRVTLSSGCKINVVTEDYAHQLGFPIHPLSQDTRDSLFGVLPPSACGEVHIRLSYENMKIIYFSSVVVKQHSCDIVAGVPFLISNGITIDMGENKIIIDDDIIVDYDCAHKRIHQGSTEYRMAPSTNTSTVRKVNMSLSEYSLPNSLHQSAYRDKYADMCDYSSHGYSSEIYCKNLNDSDIVPFATNEDDYEPNSRPGPVPEVIMPYLDLCFKGNTFRVLLHPDNCLNVVTKAFACQMDFPVLPLSHATRENLKGVLPPSACGEVDIKLVYSGFKILTFSSVVVSHNDYDFVAGMPFMTVNSIVIDPVYEEIIIDDALIFSFSDEEMWETPPVCTGCVCGDKAAYHDESRSEIVVVDTTRNEIVSATVVQDESDRCDVDHDQDESDRCDVGHDQGARDESVVNIDHMNGGDKYLDPVQGDRSKIDIPDSERAKNMVDCMSEELANTQWSIGDHQCKSSKSDSIDPKHSPPGIPICQVQQLVNINDNLIYMGFIVAAENISDRYSSSSQSHPDSIHHNSVVSHTMATDRIDPNVWKDNMHSALDNQVHDETLLSQTSESKAYVDDRKPVAINKPDNSYAVKEISDNYMKICKIKARPHSEPELAEPVSEITSKGFPGADSVPRPEMEAVNLKTMKTDCFTEKAAGMLEQVPNRRNEQSQEMIPNRPSCHIRGNHSSRIDGGSPTTVVFINDSSDVEFISGGTASQFSSVTYGREKFSAKSICRQATRRTSSAVILLRSLPLLVWVMCYMYSVIRSAERSDTLLASCPVLACHLGRPPEVTVIALFGD